MAVKGSEEVPVGAGMQELAQSVRTALLGDTHYFCVHDVVMMACNQSSRGAGRTWQRLLREHESEVAPFLSEHKFPGRGQRVRPVISLLGVPVLLQLCCPSAAATATPGLDEVMGRFGEMRISPSSGGGHCYAATNPSLPGLVKIGMTKHAPERRLKQLSGTGVPEPYRLLASVECADARATEKEAHRHFRAQAFKKEFFRVPEADVLAYFAKLQQALALTEKP